jgi:CheY-like chemotaxis protein
VPKKTSLPMKSYIGNGQKVLIIDDVKTQREIASDILSQLGYCVATVASGEEAIDYVKNNPADLLVLDMIMSPGIDGLDTYRKILEIRPKQRAIIASGFSESDRVKECERLGAGQYISKPYTFEAIGVAVKNELNRSFPAMT